MKIKVFKDGWDWVWECKEHESSCYCSDWEVAYEGALGHACMNHPVQCDHDWGYYPINNPGAHICLTYGVPLPVREACS